VLRYLSEDERHRVAEVFAEYGCNPPDNGKILVDERDGKIVALQCLHQVLHAGPVWIAPEFRGQGLWPEMQKKLESDMEPGTFFYQFGTEKNESRLRELGLTPMGWNVWGKRV
jgi:hypothetical protein